MTLSGQGYICSAGDTYDSVALSVYGDENYSCELLASNPELCTVTMFKGGEVLKLPVVEIPDVGDDEENYMPAKAPWKE